MICLTLLAWPLPVRAADAAADFFEARIRPEWGTHARPPNGITRPRPVPGIGATPAPAGLERKPGATGDRFETVFFCLLLFLLSFLQSGELLLLFIGAFHGPRTWLPQGGTIRVGETARRDGCKASSLLA